MIRTTAFRDTVRTETGRGPNYSLLGPISLFR